MSHDFPLAVVATVLACLYLPVPIIMTWFHAFDGAWKRVGARSYALHVPLYLALVALVAALHGVWHAVAWEWPPWASVCGGVTVAAAFVLLFSTHGAIDFSTLIALPQVTDSPRRELITGGVYARIRHPRSAVLIVGSLGNFLMTGYAALLAAFVFTTTLAVAMSRLEERELIAHFGDAYRRYMGDIPAFFPRVSKR